MSRILVLEDDAALRAALCGALAARGYDVRSRATAFAGLSAIAESAYDLVILDLGLPDIDGEMALKMLRAVSDVPIIVATARAGDACIVRLLNSGADDYLAKPFSGALLVARVSAVLRRVRGAVEGQIIKVGELSIDVSQRRVQFCERTLELNRKEFDLLAYLASRVGEVVARQDLIKSVWQQRHVTDDQTIDVHVSWLRKKLGETAAQPRYLHTVRGVGLKLVAP